MLIRMSMEQRILIHMDDGFQIPPMATSGYRRRLPVGPHTRRVGGCGPTTMVGPGSAMIPGVGLHITMGAGTGALCSAGPGIRADSVSACGIIGVPRWWVLWVSAAAVWVSDS